MGGALRLPEVSYGSDRDGLVCGYVFAPAGRGEPLDAAAATEWLARPREQRSFLWLHFNVSNAAAERWMEQHLELPELFRRSFRGDTGSTRVEQDGDWLVAVLNDVLFDFDFDASHVSALAMAVERHLLLSARSKPLRSIDRLRASVKQGAAFRSPAELLAHLLRDQADVMAQIVRDATRRVNEVEDRLLAHRIGSSRSQLGSLRRVLVRLQRLLAPEPAALFRLLSRPPAWIAEEDVQELRQAAEEFSTAVADSAALAERIKILQEELAALVNEQINRALFLLTVLTVLALPFNVVGGLFGMNVGGIPFSEHRGGFWWIVTLVAALTGVVGVWAFRQRPR